MGRSITFAENLRHYRTKQNLTQRQLAEKIGYTEKSISKWEGGNALPTMEITITLADLFNISLEEMLFEKNSCYYFLGIDGGGTKTAFKLTDENGTVLQAIQKGSCNPNDIGMENAMVLLKEGIGEVCKGIPYSKVTLFAGISGGGLTGDNINALRNFFRKFGFFAFDNGSDIDNLIALTEKKKSIIVIMGTGFIVYASNGEEHKRIGGWGQFFDDGGSGYTLGRDAITAALCDSDGSGEPTLLSTLFAQRLGEDAVKHLAMFYKGGKRYIADFAELVFIAAQKGDAVAKRILEKNMAYTAQKIDTAARYLATPTEEIPVLFSGGLTKKDAVLFPLINNYLSQKNCKLIRLQEEPVDGALKKAVSLFEQKLRG